MPEELGEHVAAIGALAEPTRRALYRYVATQQEPVSREQAANAVDLPLHTAKFHLDRLVEDGLLEVEFRRLSGRSGPGAGRPAKLYRRSSRQFFISLPERRYELAGDVLATAIDRSIRDGVPIAEAVSDAAADTGRQLAAGFLAEEPSASTSAENTGGDEREGLERTVQVLARHGYEPQMAGSRVLLTNCPFDRLATDHTALVCGLNLALISGVINGLQIPGVTPELAPETGLCCVQLRG
ncbi:MAG TPA: helix-turn-helix domain-containing protein [Jiangellaceae bacterium]|nr:helix-turn-helix domain-containing protein [Jiangellaceae bacterium]